MTTNFQINGVDFDDTYVKRDIFVEGGLWGWGFNQFSGQLGNNTLINRSSPVQTISAGNNWRQVSVGFQFTAAIKTDGTLWMWGDNASGQLGDNTITHRSSPVQTVSGGTNWKQVAAGSYLHTAAIKTDGTLWSWGANSFGELGTNNIVSVSSPVQTIAVGSNWKQVASGFQFTAAIKTDNTLWMWGKNEFGQLGDNSRTHRSSPVQTAFATTGWKQVACGKSFAAAVKTDGTLWTWGENANGKLGTNDIIHRSVPIQTVSGGTNWKQVACGDAHTAAIKTDGTLWLWGDNTYAQLGDNTITHRSSPVQTISGGTNWKQVAGASYHSAATKTDGTLWGWGYNAFGQLGDNTTVNKSSPVQTVAGGTNWRQIAAGYTNTFSIQENYW